MIGGLGQSAHNAERGMRRLILGLLSSQSWAGVLPIDGEDVAVKSLPLVSRSFRDGGHEVERGEP